jgi:hypothetical protein
MTNCHYRFATTDDELPFDKPLSGGLSSMRESIKDKEGFGSAHREHPDSSRAELAFHLARDFINSLTRRFHEPRPALVIVWCS